jgi:cholesterol 7-dehydrogenase
MIHRWNACEGSKHMAKATIDHIVQFWTYKFLKIDADVTQVGPGYVVLKLKTFFGDMTILQTVTPVEPLKQRLLHYFYGPRWLGIFMKFSIYGETVNVARDAMVWDYKTFVRNPILPKEEKQIKLYRNWFSQFYSENSKSYQDAQNDLSW